MNSSEQANEEANKLIGEIMAKSWTDESFKKRLLEDANATLAAEGVYIQDGITVKVLENTANVINFVLPRNPAELSDADLEMVAGGKPSGGCGMYGGQFRVGITWNGGMGLGMIWYPCGHNHIPKNAGGNDFMI